MAYKGYRNWTTWARAPYIGAERWLYAHGVLSSRGLPLPDFLGIGAKKAGTTWLWENLRHHPDLYLSEDKEVHFFDRRFRLGVQAYSRKFAAGAGKVKGEITPEYATLLPDRIRFVNQLMPDVKLVFILRNPIDRAWSHAVDMARIFHEDPHKQLDEGYLAHFDSLGSRLCGDYLRTIEAWASVFPRDRLHVAYFEDIAACPQELLRGVFEHLGVCVDVDWSLFPYNRVIHKGSRQEIPHRFKAILEDMYRDQIETLYHSLGERAAGWRCEARYD